MSKKKENVIKYKGLNYELAFNLNAMEEIQEEYGSVEAWGDLIESTEEPNAKAIKFGLGAMLNEGIDIYNEEHENDENFKPRKPFNLKQVGRVITEIGLGEIAKSIKDTVVDSSKTDEKN